MLDSEKKDKKKKLYSYIKYLNYIRSKIKKDGLMRHFFYLKKKCSVLSKNVELPNNITQTFSKCEKDIQLHYVANYMMFYDVLFVDTAGDIFYTFKKESDYQKNIFKGNMRNTSISKKLISTPLSAFVDFEYYEFSKEPSAFFIIPIIADGHLDGWMLLQCALNRINDIFTNNRRKFATLETILVNKNNCMMTESRFILNAGELKTKLASKNICEKFREKKGHKKVKDYRGKWVLSSFEVCRIFNAEWLLIVKIDLREVITKLYKKDEDVYLDLILKKMVTNQKKLSHECCFCENSINCKVDMNEIKRVGNHGKLATYGVSSCLTAIISMPGKFSYMLHVSPLDKLFDGGLTDLFSKVLYKIEKFDIYGFQKNDLQVVLVSRAKNRIKKTVNFLINKGYYLSQIKGFYFSGLEYADICHDAKKGFTCIKCFGDKSLRTFMLESRCNYLNFGAIMTKRMNL
jgi:hypothetical protein